MGGSLIVADCSVSFACFAFTLLSDKPCVGRHTLRVLNLGNIVPLKRWGEKQRSRSRGF